MVNTPPAEPITLRQTNVSRPQLAHSSSQQSITAEEDYLSAHSEQSLSTSAEGDMQPSPDTRQPPQSLVSTHTPGVETFQPSTQATYARLQADAQTSRPSNTGRVRRKPVASGRGAILSTSSSSDSNDKVSENVPQDQRAETMDRGISPSISLGVDDTPYVRFALDQLTRDEDVRGSRRYPAGNPRTAVATYPTSNAPRAHDPTPPAPVAVPSYAAPIRATPALPPIRPQPSRDTDDDAGYHTADEDPRNVAPIQTTPRPFNTLPQTGTLSNIDVFVPFDQEVPPLSFLPAILRPAWLGLFTFLCLLVVVGLLFSGIYSGINSGLFEYTQFGGARWFVFQYLPLIIGMFLLLWLFQIQVAVQRIMPFVAMASYNSKSRSQAPLMEMQTTNFLLPKIFYFHAGQTIVGTTMFVFWLQIFTIPLFACVYNVYFYGPPNSGEWRWMAVQQIVWTLFALYLLLVLALIVLGIWLWRQRTGLRWDPRSIADIIALLDRSNILLDYQGSETFSSSAQFRQKLSLRSDRLGYWTTSSRPNDAFYGVGEEGGPTRHYSIQAGQLLEKPSPEEGRSHFSPDTPTTPGGVHLEEDDEYNRVRYRHLPWYLHTSMALLWVTGGLVLYLAFLIVSYVNDAVIRGFRPLLPVAPHSDGFSSTNFLYSFVPAVIAQLIFLSWLSVDYAFRRLEPYAGMVSSSAKQMGGSAENSLLLDYTARLPISVSFAAAKSRHFRVAWFSSLSLVAACLPILAGGTFWAQFYIPQQEVRVAVEPAGYYVLSVFLAIFAFSLPLILFGMHKRRLPHGCTTLAEQISWLYASRLLGEREWRASVASKSEMASRLFAANTARERELEGGRFFFGRITGKDGKAHIGIDRIGRQGGRAYVPMSQRSWRGDSGAPLTTAPRTERRVGYGNPSPVPGARGLTSNIMRSGSGRFVPIPVAATEAAPSGNALSTVYDDGESGEAVDQKTPTVPEQRATAVGGRARASTTNSYGERAGLLSESAKPALVRDRERGHARQMSSIDYPSGSSHYPSSSAKYPSDAPSYRPLHTSDPYADQGLSSTTEQNPRRGV